MSEMLTGILKKIGGVLNLIQSNSTNFGWLSIAVTMITTRDSQKRQMAKVTANLMENNSQALN